MTVNQKENFSTTMTTTKKHEIETKNYYEKMKHTHDPLTVFLTMRTRRLPLMNLLLLLVLP